MRNNKKRKGFTIVELVIVIAVIGILAAILIPTFINLTSRANQVQAESFVKNINTNLAMKQAKTGKQSASPNDAVKTAIDAGFDVTKIKPSEENVIVYDWKADRFALVNKNYEESRSMADVIYSEGDIKGTGDEVYKVFSAKPESTTFGIYAAGEWPAALTVTGNFDQGLSTGTTSVTLADPAAAASPLVYGGSFRAESKKSAAPARKVSVRTNSATTEFVVNSAAEVTHHGKAKSVDYQNAGALVINGEYPFLEIGSGNVIIAAGAKVDVLYLNANNDGKFDDIKITLEADAELPAEIKRDSIGTDIGDALVKVCTIETPIKTEEIYLKGNGTIEDAQVYVAANGAEAAPVTEASASNEAKALANAKIGDEVEDKGSTEEAKQEAKQEAAAEAQAKEVEEESKESGRDYTATIGKKGYDSLEAAIADAEEGETVVLLKDVELNARIELAKSITLKGNGHKVTLPNNKDSRAFNVDSHDDLKVKFVDIEIDAPKSERGLSFYNAHNITLEIIRSKVTASKYAINFASLTTIDVTIEDSEIAGWAALNIWSNGISVKATGSIFKGLNNQSLSKWNSFCVICLESDSTGMSPLHSSDMVLTFSKCTLIAEQTTGNKQSIIGFNNGESTGAMNNKVYLYKCDLRTIGDGTDLYYDHGTENKLYVNDCTMNGEACDDFESPYLHKSELYDDKDSCIADFMEIIENPDSPYEFVNFYVNGQGKYYFTYADRAVD